MNLLSTYFPYYYLLLLRSYRAFTLNCYLLIWTDWRTHGRCGACGVYDIIIAHYKVQVKWSWTAINSIIMLAVLLSPLTQQQLLHRIAVRLIIREIDLHSFELLYCRPPLAAAPCIPSTCKFYNKCTRFIHIYKKKKKNEIKKNRLALLMNIHTIYLSMMWCIKFF